MTKPPDDRREPDGDVGGDDDLDRDFDGASEASMDADDESGEDLGAEDDADYDYDDDPDGPLSPDDQLLFDLVERRLGIRDALTVTQRLRAEPELRERFIQQLMLDIVYPAIRHAAETPPPPACGAIRALFAGYREGTSAPSESARLSAHLESCEPCDTAFLFDEVSNGALVRATPPPRQPVAWYRRRRTLIAAAAIVLLGLAVSGIMALAGSHARPTGGGDPSPQHASENGRDGTPRAGLLANLDQDLAELPNDADGLRALLRLARMEVARRAGDADEIARQLGLITPLSRSKDPNAVATVMRAFSLHSRGTTAGAVIAALPSVDVGLEDFVRGRFAVPAENPTREPTTRPR